MSDISLQTPVADFPVFWENPGDAKLFWQPEPHLKIPIPPLNFAVVATFYEGCNPAMDQLALPFHTHVKRINTYAYLGIAPTAVPPEAVLKTIGVVNRVAPGVIKALMGKMMDGMSKQQVARLNPIIERFDAFWQEELLPEIKQHLTYFESCDLRGLSMEQLRAHFTQSLKRVERMATLHMLSVNPAFFAMSQFDDLYRELFDGATTLDALRLLQGFDNKVLEGDRALWRLSRAALAIPAVRQVLTDCAPGGVIGALERSSEGRGFLAGLRAWLNEYGQRLSSIFTLTEPGWVEDPTVVIENLKAYITQPIFRADAEQAALAAEREQAIAEARAKLAGYPQPVAARFETLLKAAQTATMVHEEHNYWIDQRLLYQVRRLILEFGRRLAETGQIEIASDVFYLTVEELLAVPGRAGPVLNGTSLKERVRERKAEMEHFSHITPPAMLGTAPAFEVGDNAGPVIRAFTKVDGAALSLKETNGKANGGETSLTVKGQAGSAGVTRGPARIIHSLAEAGKLQKGDVLVAETTAPSWTPLFATAAAVVTDQGGVLSHCAVVAREYHIPAVVGTRAATKTFRDGQLLEVDGNTGTARILTSSIEE